MKKLNLTLLLIVLIVPILFTDCKLLILPDNKIKIDDSIVGVWERIGKSKSKSLYAIEKVNDYLAHVYDLDEGIDRDNPEYRITFHQINNHRFISLQFSDNSGVTLFLSKLSSTEIILSNFRLQPDSIDESFGDLDDKAMKEFVFTSAIEKGGIAVGSEDRVFKKLYGLVIDKP